MDHPILSNIDFSNVSEEEINTKIGELYNKLNMAYQFGNEHMIQQIMLLLEAFKAIQQGRLFEKQKSDGIDDATIDIDWPDPFNDKKEERKDF